MKKNGFMEGAIIATIAIIISKILGVLYVIPFYRLIGSEGGALYGYAYNIYNIFLIISTAGIPLAISKLTSEYETKKEYEKKYSMYKIAKQFIYLFSLISFLICFIFAKPIGAFIVGDLNGANSIEDVAYVIRSISFALLIVPVLSISRGYLQGHKYIAPSSFSQVIEQLVRIIIILIGSYIAVKVLNLPVKYAIAISTLAAAIGALVSFIYLYIKEKKVKCYKNVDIKKISKKEKKEILSKIIGYSIPFIVINIANSLFNTTDMILLIRGLNNLGYNGSDIEEISAVFTTWGNKLLSIVKAFATGLTISLIPSLVSAYIKKDNKTVNEFFNKALQILLFIILPATIFMSIFASEIWKVFYSESTYGPIILKYSILVAVFDSACILITSSLQGIYKKKLIYISILTGLLENLILDLPLIYLFNKLGLYPFYGAITATIIGYLLSIGIPLVYLHKKDNFSYNETWKLLPRLILSLISIIILSIAYKLLMPSFNGYLTNILYIAIIGIIYVTVFFLINKDILLKLLSDKLPFRKKK